MFTNGRWSTLIGATLLFAMMLSGCEQVFELMPYLKPAAEDNFITTPPPPISTENPSQPTLFPSAGEEISRITIWLPPALEPGSISPQGTLLQQRLESFAKIHPEYELEIRIKAVAGSGGLLDTLTTASTAAPAVLPGIILLPLADFESAVSEGLLMPIADEDFNAVSQDWFPFADEMTSINGARYGLPFAADALALAYIPSDPEEPPTSWQEILQKQNITSFPAAEPKALFTLLLYSTMGGELSPGNKYPGLQPDPLRNSLQFLSEAVNQGVFRDWMAEYSTYEQSLKGLLENRSEYSLIWTSQYLTGSSPELSISPLPALNGSTKTFADAWVIGFPRTSQENYEVSRELAQHLLDARFMGSWSEAAGLLPVTRSQLTAWNDSQVSGILLKIAESAQPVPNNKVINLVSPLITQATMDILLENNNYLDASKEILKALED